MSEEVLVTDEGGVRTILMNRPDKKNALSHNMYAIMADAIVSGEADPEIRIFVIAGSDTCFTSGNDLMAFLATPPDPKATERPPVSRFMFALLEAKKPVIAAVEGPAVGVGVTMLLHCDFVYAGKEAFFITPFVNLALPPEFASTLLLPFAVGTKKAVEMLMLGEKTTAKSAAKMGLITAMVATGSALETAQKTAHKLAAKAPAAMQLTKKLLSMAPESPVARMNRESVLFTQRMPSAEVKESVTAFFEKRKPNYSACEE